VLASTVPPLIFAVVMVVLFEWRPGAAVPLWAILAGGLLTLAIAAGFAVMVGARIVRGMATLAHEMAGTEASFRLMFANNPLPMWVYDLATLDFLEVNAAAVEHYGYARDEFLRMRLTDIRPAEEVPRLKDVVAGIATGATAGRRDDATWKHRLKDGRIRQVEIVAHAIDFAGRPAVLVVVIDVTELKQAEAARARYAERLRILHEIDAAIIAAEAPVAIAEAALGPLRDLLDVPRAIVNMFDLETGEVEWLAAIGRRRLRTGPGVRFPLALMGDVEALRRGELQHVTPAGFLPAPTSTRCSPRGSACTWWCR
jgi:PAS domain S-box-containing protein